MKNFKKSQTDLIQELRNKGIQSRAVLEAFAKVQRHLFVDEAMQEDAYKDQALPIGNGQTISQPYIVALMTEALELGDNDKILEIGTGSGFQAAILAQFSRRVFTVERDPFIARRTMTLLKDLGYQNIMFKVGDGSRGWLANAPYDRIIVTAGATEDVPPALLSQLKDGGRMLVPSGSRSVQQLLVIEKKGDQLIERDIGAVVFVPLRGEEGWK